MKANASNLANVAKTSATNTFTETQAIQNGNMGVNSPALVISARTDQNIYSRPAIYFDCYETVEASLFFDTDSKLKIKIGETTLPLRLLDRTRQKQYARLLLQHCKSLSRHRLLFACTPVHFQHT